MDVEAEPRSLLIFGRRCRELFAGKSKAVVANSRAIRASFLKSVTSSNRPLPMRKGPGVGPRPCVIGGASALVAPHNVNGMPVVLASGAGIQCFFKLTVAPKIYSAGEENDDRSHQLEKKRVKQVGRCKDGLA
jgi:hypothetical protein